TGVCQAIRSQRSEFRQTQRSAKVLQNIAASLPIGQLYTQAYASRDDGDLLGFEFDDAQFCDQTQPSLLRHDQELAVGVIEKTPLHGAVGRIQMNADTALLTR